ncbi:MAG: competence protein ComEC [Methylobacteriaceae bacterium]|nr:competence protein ComEC [Methylobacteriaceae bacterium]
MRGGLQGGSAAIAGTTFGLAGRLRLSFGDPRALFWDALEREIAERRPFLWLPAAAGAGVILYLSADREPVLWLPAVALVAFAALAWLARTKRGAFALFVGLAAICAGFVSAGWKGARVAAPVLDRIRVTTVTGFIEQMDYRRQGARFVVRLASAEGLSPEQMPRRVRLTDRYRPPVEAGAFVKLKARLLPPARAALPGGYDFARDAYFAELGAVGNVLGKIETVAPPAPPRVGLSFYAAIDRMRNALAERVYTLLGGERGAIGAAMVTGKRDYLDEATKDVIREAGIFHIITISGVQMTLVAAIFFIGLRRLLACSRTLALNYPIKKWAAAAAMAGAIFYDIATGSRVGTERALIMTCVMLCAVIFDRPSLTMRNLAIAAMIVIAIEPEAILGASFQLSFAAVAALVAVYEARIASFAADRERFHVQTNVSLRQRLRDFFAEHLRHGPGALIFATFCATAATASFMAYDFHELSPYVLIGNPLTLAIIEFFAIPGALIGAVLYPLGLDAFVWQYVGLGIGLILWAARLIASAPGATVHLKTFAPYALIFLSLAVLSAVIWRTALLRATAIPLAIIGLWGAARGPDYDIAVAATGESAAVRTNDGQLAVLGVRPSAFLSEQWLRADADPRAPKVAQSGAQCDGSGCAAQLPDGRVVALLRTREALVEDCARAALVIAPFPIPSGCGATTIIDRRRLGVSGAVTLKIAGDHFETRAARAIGENRPWSRAPRAVGRVRSVVPPEKSEENSGEMTRAIDRLD